MIVIALALTIQAVVEQPKSDCAYDRAALMALDQDAFDQDMNGGWRALEDRGCDAEAADLIRDYRQAKSRPHPSILYWHEGQIRATLGQNDAAIALFNAARKPSAEDTFGWNFYVDGSIAFLRHDRAGLQSARDALAQVPEDKEWVEDAVRQGFTVQWPPNLNILDGFLKCFDRSYRDAYGSKSCT